MGKGAEEWWTNMSLEDRKKLLVSGDFWGEMNTYYWRYLPGYVRGFLEDEYEKSLR